jgi:polyferredoxin
MLLAERFWPGAGWLEILALSSYAAWLVWKMHEVRESARWRRRAWLLFSLVFFGQLAAGLAGADRLLMSGELHLPVPAMIVAGPAFRGEGLFMPVLFASTLLLVGPAWCSHLCYLGSWDELAARARRRPRPLPRWSRSARPALLAAVVICALALRLAGVPVFAAAAVGLGFGIAGVGVMLLVSRRYGAMAHCTVWCPIGLLAGLGGRASPFRVSFTERCDRCGACAPACRFDALRPEDIERGKPAASCTLCGDCLGRCGSAGLEYRFAGRSVPWARSAFLAVVVSLHAICMGVARI